MRKLLSRCLKELKIKEEKVNATNDYIQKLNYLNKVNGVK